MTQKPNTRFKTKANSRSRKRRNKMNKIDKKPSRPPQATRAYPRPGTKYFNILEHFRLHGTLNKLEAQSLGETCLSATISDMRNDFNLEVPRHTEKALNGAGCNSTVTRYWFSKHDIYVINSIKQRSDHGQK